MELLARGVHYPYASHEELLAIKAIQYEWNANFLSAMASISTLSENSVRSVIEQINEHFHPEMKYKRFERVRKFQDMFHKLREMGSIKIRPAAI